MELTPEELAFLGPVAPKPSRVAAIETVAAWTAEAKALAAVSPETLQDAKCERGHTVGKRPLGLTVLASACETCKLTPRTVPADMPLPDPLERLPDGWVDAACPACGHVVGKRGPGHVIDPASCPNWPHAAASAEPEKPKVTRGRKPKVIPAARPPDPAPEGLPVGPAEPPLLPTPTVTVLGATTAELTEIAEHIANAPLTVTVELGPKTIAALAQLLTHRG